MILPLLEMIECQEAENALLRLLLAHFLSARTSGVTIIVMCSSQFSFPVSNKLLFQHSLVNSHVSMLERFVEEIPLI